jgi:hypothetical protein
MKIKRFLPIAIGRPLKNNNYQHMKKNLIVFGLNLLAFLIIFLPCRFFILQNFFGDNPLAISIVSFSLSAILSPKFSLYPKTTAEQLLMKLPFIKRPYLFNLFKKMK